MAERIEIKTIVTPAGTLTSAPLITTLNFREGYPVLIEILFPPGPSGLVGLQLRHSDANVIPKNPAEYLVTDNEIVKWPLDNYPYNAKWKVVTYNTDVYPHTIQLRMLLNEIGTRAFTAATPPPITPLLASIPGA